MIAVVAKNWIGWNSVRPHRWNVPTPRQEKVCSVVIVAKQDMFVGIVQFGVYIEKQEKKKRRMSVRTMMSAHTLDNPIRKRETKGYRLEYS
jgi:hypothetical protein